MVDMLVYWRDYRRAQVSGLADRPTWRWHSNARMLGNLHGGDRVWLVTSGARLKIEPAQAGFLVAVWQVREVIPNPGDAPRYPPDRYAYRLLAEPSASVIFDEPVAVDHILRSEGADKAAPIGRFLQGPRRLSEQKVRLLRSAAGPQMAVKYLTGRQT